MSTEYRTNMSPISIIVAVDKDGGFGKEGKIPWSLSADMRHFKETTTGGICIMGRATYEDMLQMSQTRSPSTDMISEILPNRTSYVVTSDPNYSAPGAIVVPGIRDAIHSILATDTREVFVLGGRRMFIEAMAIATKLYITLIKGDSYDCDVFFPVSTIEKNFVLAEGSQNDNMYFLTYKRKRSNRYDPR